MNKTNKRFNVRNLVFMALICALAYICTFVLHIKVSFLTFDLKNTVFAIGSLIFGPVSAIVTSLVVALLEMITISDTGIWGCIMNFLTGAVYAFFVGLVYKYKKTLSGAMLGLVVGSVATVVLMCLWNLVITPIYTGQPVEAILDLMLPLILPFNAIKVITCSAATMMLYKPVRTVFKGAGVNFSSDGKYSLNKKTVLITVVSALIIVLCVVLFIFCLNGSFSLYENLS